MKLLIAVPAYNEQSVIKSVLESIPAKYKQLGDIDVLVVNDGSSNKTSQEVLRSKRRVTLVEHPFNLGAGAATLTALDYAKLNDYDFMVTMDADGQHDIEDVFKVLQYCIDNKLDLVVGDRLGDGNSQMSKFKLVGNKMISRLTSFLMGGNIKDSQSGLRAYSRKSILNLRFKSLDYIFCSEMIMRANQLKLKIGQTNIKAIYTDYSKSKGQSSWNGIEFIRKMLVLRIMEIF